jgi:serine protease
LIIMDEERAPGKRRNLVWLLLILAVILVWWWWRSKDREEGAAAADPAASVAALAETDPDDLLVDLKDGVSDDRIAEIEAQLGIDLVLLSRQSADERMYRVHVAPELRDATIEALSKLPDVEIAEPDAQVSLIPQLADPAPDDDAAWEGYPNDPLYKHQWHLDQIGMREAWKHAGGEGVIVAVIDTGVAYENKGKFHRVPDLEGVPMVKPYDFVNDRELAADDHGHGTHVAGTIAQATHNKLGVAGVARKATIMPLKVLSAGGSGSVGAIADAIRYAADNGAKVINMSLGGRFRSKILEKAVKYAHDKGVTVVCAAGNDGSGRVSFPAAYPGAVAVAATQFDEATTFYSNWGKEIDVAAPGGNTQVDQNKDGMPDGVLQNTIVVGDPTRDGYFPFMGTSMASPHVAGVAALIVGEGVNDPKKVEQILEETARPPKGRKMDTQRYGAGIVDAAAAVKKARSETSTTPLALAGLVALGFAFAARRRIGPAFLASLVIGAGGLTMVPLVGDTFLARGFPSWDLAFLGASSHGNPLFFSALVPLVLVALGFGVRKLRPWIAGFAAGVAGHLLFHLAARPTDITYVPNVLGLDAIWLAVNALISLALAAVVLRSDRA